MKNILITHFFKILTWTCILNHDEVTYIALEMQDLNFLFVNLGIDFCQKLIPKFTNEKFFGSLSEKVLCIGICGTWIKCKLSCTWTQVWKSPSHWRR